MQTNVPVAVRPSSSVHLILLPNIERIISIAGVVVVLLAVPPSGASVDSPISPSSVLCAANVEDVTDEVDVISAATSVMILEDMNVL